MKLVIITIASAILMLTSCEPTKPIKYKYVIGITHKEHTYPVTITNNTGGNPVERGATGAILGGGLDMAFGGDGTSGAVIGGLLGVATTDKPKSESYTEMRTDIIYTILFNDSTILMEKNYCPLTIGDSIPVF